MSRLTDEELDEALELCERSPAGFLAERLTGTTLPRALTELKERRAGELTEEEREALTWLRDFATASSRNVRSQSPISGDRIERAITCLSLLLANGGAK